MSLRDRTTGSGCSRGRHPGRRAVAATPERERKAAREPRARRRTHHRGGLRVLAGCGALHLAAVPEVGAMRASRTRARAFRARFFCRTASACLPPCRLTMFRAPPRAAPDSKKAVKARKEARERKPEVHELALGEAIETVSQVGSKARLGKKRGRVQEEEEVRSLSTSRGGGGCAPPRCALLTPISPAAAHSGPEQQDSGAGSAAARRNRRRGEAGRVRARAAPRAAAAPAPAHPPSLSRRRGGDRPSATPTLGRQVLAAVQAGEDSDEVRPPASPLFFLFFTHALS